MLNPTLEDVGFDGVFTEVGNGVTLGLANNNYLRTFHLNAENCAFVFDGLQDFLVDNIGQYIYSRLQIDNFKSDGKIKTVAYRAVELLKKAYKLDGNSIGDELGDIMLYVLLEKILGAPKLFSKIEMSRGGDVASSHGVHLLSLGDEQHFQMVYGKSRIDGDIKDAIDDAFAYLKKIKEEGLSNYHIVESGILEKSFDKATTDTLKSILIPKKAATVSMNKAFGIFLGYTLGLKTSGLTHDGFLDEMALKMSTDIQAHIGYLVGKIKEAGMESYSFYVYALPFNDASEKHSVMNALLGR
jgi:hypothetical protein